MDITSPSIAKDILVIVLSKTPEKVAHFELVAKGTRVKFIDIHRLAEGYNVAPEDTGDRKDNALQKANAVLSTLQKLNDPNSSEHRNLLAQCQVLGIAYDPSKIFIAVEDSTFTTSPGVWPFLRKKLKGLVSDDLLKKYSGSSTPPNYETGPGAETGPIVSATGGFLRFYNLLLHAYQDVREKHGVLGLDTEIRSQSTVVLRRLDSLPDEKYNFDAEVTTQLLRLAAGEDYDGNHYITDPYAYVTDSENNEIPISSNLEDYIRERSPRAQVFKKMYQEIFSLLPETSPSSIHTEQAAAAREITQPIKPQSHNPKKINYHKTLRERIYDIINRESLISDVGAEGLILGTFDPTNLSSRIKALYELTSLVVAKQLIARDMFKPIVIWDDGCWEPLIKTLASLANKGMAKDFIPFVTALKDRDIEHVASSFFDCLRFNPHKYDRDQMPDLVQDDVLAACRIRQTEALQKMSYTIIRERAVGYHDFIQPQQLLRIHAEGAPPNGELFTVGHFVSATSDNKTVIEQSQSLGTHLANNGMGYVWGGMNMHAGGEAFKAYKSAGGIHAAAYSTVPIAAAETENGQLPENADYREWSRDIYERMAGMIAASDVIVISPGGWGTFQELLALLVLKDQAPELFANKKIIIHNPAIHDGEEFSGGRFWNRSIRAIFNVDYHNKDFSSVRDKDVYIVHNEEMLNKLISKLRDNWSPQHNSAHEPPNRFAAQPGRLDT